MNAGPLAEEISQQLTELKSKIESTSLETLSMTLKDTPKPLEETHGTVQEALQLTERVQIASNDMATFWARMAQIYGHKWTSSHGLMDEDNIWLIGLSGCSKNQIKLGLNFLVKERSDSWPPSLPEFREICMAQRDFTPPPLQIEQKLTQEEWKEKHLRTKAMSLCVKMRFQMGFDEVLSGLRDGSITA